MIHANWWGIEIMRPSNVLTNMVVVLWCTLLIWRLAKEVPENTGFRLGWAHYFAWVAVAALVGGIAHGFNYGYPAIRHTPWHRLAWIGGGIGMFALSRTSTLLYAPHGVKRWFLALQLVQITVYIGAIGWSLAVPEKGFNDFNIPRIHAAICMLVWTLPLHLYAGRYYGTSSWRYLLMAIFTIMLTLPFYNYQINLAPWFDYNDISHGIEMLSLYFYFRCAKTTLTETNLIPPHTPVIG